MTHCTSRAQTMAIALAVLTAGFFACEASGQDGSGAPTNYVDRPAVFRVGTDVANADLQPFTITAGAFGNTVFKKDTASFEPTVFRTRLWAADDGENRIPVDPVALSQWDSWRSGYLDGADVRVYRFRDNKLHLVRRDKVAPGGTVLSGWKREVDENLIPPGTTEFLDGWADYNRDDVPNFYAVFARDKSGNVSKMSNVVKVMTPPKGKRGGGERNPHRRVRFRRRSDDKTPPPAPRNVRGELRDDGVFVLRWDPVDDDELAGYFVAQSDVDPAGHEGFFLRLAGKARSEAEKIRKGDLIIVGTKWYTFDRSVRSNRLGDLWRTTREFYPDMMPNEFYPEGSPEASWRLVKHADETPVDEPGETYIEMTLGEGVEKQIGSYCLGGRNGDWYHVPHETPYTVEVWIKADRADAPEVRFDVHGDALPGVEPIAFQPTAQWKKFTATFQGKGQDKARPTRLALSFQGPATYSVDNFRVYRSDVAFLDYEPRYYERLKHGRMGRFRTHGPIKTGTTTYDMDQFLDAPGTPKGIAKGNTLVQMLRMMSKAEIQPWLQIEFHMSPEEWLALVEYLAAPYEPGTDTPQSKPWAYRRVRQGRPEPWVEEFDEIWLELSNETWNWLFTPWVFEGMIDHATGEKVNRGRVYGAMQEHVIGILRSSPYWTDECERKFAFPVGGWSGSNYGREAIRATPGSNFMTIAAYNGGWDEGEGPPQTNPASYFNVLSQVNQTAIPRALQHLRERVEWRKEGFQAGLGTYEAGPGYALNGLNGARVSARQAAEQERVMKSKLAGTATLDTFLVRAYYDFDTQNFFTFSEGRTWSSHAKWYRGGQAYPCYLWLEVFNRLALGDMLAVETRSVPTVDTRKYRRRKAIQGAPLAAAYATAKGDRVALFCISRKFAGYPESAGDGYTPFSVELPFEKVSKITLYKLSGEVTDHNIDAERVKLVSQRIPTSAFDKTFGVHAATGADGRGLPPGEAFLYVFEGVGMPEGRTLTPSELLEMPVTFAK